MYTLADTTVRSYQTSLGIYSIDASDVVIRTLANDHAEVFLTLTHPLLTGPQVLNLKDVEGLVFSTEVGTTVSQWLTLIGNITLPLTPGTIEITSARVQMDCAFASGYVVKSSTGSSGSDTGDVLPEDMAHLALTRGAMDYREMQQHVLATVGGYLHRTDAGDSAFYIRDAGETQRICKSQKVNLISLDKISRFDIVPFAQCTLTPQEGPDLNKGVVVVTPNSLVGKTVWLSIGGYLLCLGKDFWVVNEKALYINWPAINFAKKYMRSRQSIDLSAVNVAMGITDGSVIDQTMLESNAAITAYLHLSQSFLIVLDEPTIYVNLDRLEDTGLPGKYYVYNHPYSVMMTDDGRIPSVSWFNEQKAWVISTGIDSGMIDIPFQNVMNPDDTSLYTNKLMDAGPHSRSVLYQVQMTSSKMVIKVE